MKTIAISTLAALLVSLNAPAFAQPAASAPPTRAQVKADTRKALATEKTPGATEETPAVTGGVAKPRKPRAKAKAKAASAP